MKQIWFPTKVLNGVRLSFNISNETNKIKLKRFKSVHMIVNSFQSSFVGNLVIVL